MGNGNLSAAKAAKNDEFYTQLPEIQAELSHYTDKFKDKVVFCNCDDAFESNFVKYFLMNFNRLGLKLLIATGYKTSPVQGTEVGVPGQPYALRVSDTSKYLVGDQTDLDIAGAKYFLETEGRAVMTPLVGNMAVDENGDVLQVDVKEEYVDSKTGKMKKRTVKQDVYYEAGDFRSDMCVDFLCQADVVVTNPPFSLFREYVSLLMEYQKQFLIIGNNNAITYKEIFPLIKDNKMWLGVTRTGTGSMWFRVSDDFPIKTGQKIENGIRYQTIGNSSWFTNLDHEKRHQMLPLDLGYTYYGHEDMYPKYDNYDAIEVSKVNQIPYDYFEAMGVPITFLGKYCPEQFEILNCNDFRVCESVPCKAHGLIKDKEGTITEQNSIRTYAYQADTWIWLPVRLLMERKFIAEFSCVEDWKQAISDFVGCNCSEIPYCSGVIGVPITFLGRYCPEQFEIVRFRHGNDEKDLSVNGKCPYFRILIRQR